MQPARVTESTRPDPDQLLADVQREEALGFRSTVRLDVPRDDVRARRARGTGRLKHRVRLADTGRSAEEDAQSAPLGARLVALHVGEQLIGVGSGTVSHASWLLRARG